jgi:hypothetical protein
MHVTRAPEPREGVATSGRAARSTAKGPSSMAREPARQVKMDGANEAEASGLSSRCMAIASVS